MEIPLGNTMRVVVAGRPRARKQYGSGPDGSREVIGVEVDASGTPMSSFAATLASPTVGWTEGASVVAPAPVLVSLVENPSPTQLVPSLLPELINRQR